MRKIVAANFKMNLTAAQTADYAETLAAELADDETAREVEVVVAPPFTALDRAAQAFAGSPIALAAQDVNAEPSGALTGEICVEMLSELSCSYAIIGHSERRQHFGETDAGVSAKAVALLAAGMRPIVCIGETLDQREAGRTLTVVAEQLSGSLAGVPAAKVPELVVAYEPIWAIGTGQTATPELAQEVHAAIRNELEGLFGPPGRQIRLLYGGSVKPENAGQLLGQPDIDGALVGGASLDPASFAGIVRAALSR